MDRDDERRARVPRWVKLLLIAAGLAALAVVIVMMVVGGGHGPARHFSGLSPAPVGVR